MYRNRNSKTMLTYIIIGVVCLFLGDKFNIISRIENIIHKPSAS